MPNFFLPGLPITSNMIGMGSLEQLRENVVAIQNFEPPNEQDRKSLEICMASLPTSE